MRPTLPVTLLFLLLCGPVFVTGAEPEISPARKEGGVLSHRVKCEYQAGETTIRVLLPERLEPDVRYRVVYVLPVEPGDGQRWGDALGTVRAEDLHNRHGVICVYPTFSALPWYADHPSDEGIRQEAYLLRVVVPFIDRTYPTRADRSGRLLVGFSKSGWGAFSLLLRNPETFERAAAWDAPLMKARPDQFGMGPIFGSQENFERYQVTSLLRERADEFSGVARLIHLGYGSFRQHHVELESVMSDLGVTRVFRDGPHRKHAWDSGWLPEAFELLTEGRS